jgi:hypothetical protein
MVISDGTLSFGNFTLVYPSADRFPADLNIEIFRHKPMEIAVQITNFHNQKYRNYLPEIFFELHWQHRKSQEQMRTKRSFSSFSLATQSFRIPSAAKACLSAFG